MTFPVTVGPGKTSFVANPDQLKYFFWKGQKTSAQYYVNKQGVSENEACTWGEILKGKGNWAPAVFGTSFDDGTMHQGFASLKQNELCKKERLGYDITFVGDGVVSACRYKSATNQWCQGNECWDDVDRGCTVSVVLVLRALKLTHRFLGCYPARRPHRRTIRRVVHAHHIQRAGPEPPTISAFPTFLSMYALKSSLLTTLWSSYFPH
jgi:hypothetical protein